MTYHLTARSSNKKTGPLPVVTSSADTCPPSCGMRDACYAKQGPLFMHWARVTSGDRGGSLAELCKAIAGFFAGQPWRYAVAGDLPGRGDSVDSAALDALTSANNHKPGWAYTHKPVLDDEGNAEAIARANVNGFTVNLSGNNPEHADALADMGIAPVVAVVDEVDGWKQATTPRGRRIVRCPAEYLAHVTCHSCGAGRPLCSRQRDYIVGFTPHGARHKEARKVSREFRVLS